ncbi:MAG TPA: porin family protein [Balneolales bacterium]|nr:porin family protein [Balneolales bacterium]
MKKIIFLSLITVFILGFYGITNAQMFGQRDGQATTKIQYGVIGGLNFADFTGKDISGAKSRLTGNGGIFAAFQFGDYFAVQPEALVSFRGAEADVTDGNFKYRMAYIQVPVFAKARYETESGLTPYVIAGPSVSFLISDKYQSDLSSGKTTGDLKDLGVKTNDVLFDLNFGAGLQMGRLMLEGRYQYGVTDVFKNINGLSSDAKHSVFTINLGVGLNPVSRR